MANLDKSDLLAELKGRYGPLKKLEGTNSLFEIGNGAARIYFRYSKLHGGKKAFYGLRKEDLQQLEGFPSVICFLWDEQRQPLFVRFADYEDVFHTSVPAKDGQFKPIIYPHDEGTEMYIPRAGRFNVEANFGYELLDQVIDSNKLSQVPDLSHSQVQTMLGAVGFAKGYDVWIPAQDRGSLDWSVTNQFDLRDELPKGFDLVKAILQEIDVVWLHRGSSDLRALFEVEHSTPVYSGLLRFNDVHLVAPKLISRFTVVSNDTRRSLFVRQLTRPTFRTSGLSDLCTFLDYGNVFGWHNRIKSLHEKHETESGLGCC